MRMFDCKRLAGAAAELARFKFIARAEGSSIDGLRLDRKQGNKYVCNVEIIALLDQGDGL